MLETIQHAIAGPPPVPLLTEPGVSLDELPVGTKLEVKTRHHTYLVENLGEGKARISGHPEYCPTPVVVDFYGATGRGTMIKMWRIEPGLRMEFHHPEMRVIRTSPVIEVHQLKVPLAA